MLTLIQKRFTLKMEILLNPESSSVSHNELQILLQETFQDSHMYLFSWCISIILALSITPRKLYLQTQ